MPYGAAHTCTRCRVTSDHAPSFVISWSLQLSSWIRSRQ